MSSVSVRRGRLLPAIAAAALLAAACTSAPGEGDTGDQGGPAEDELIDVTFSRSIALTFAPTLLAEATGLFEEEGLNVVPTTVQSGADTMALLASGTIDFGALPISNLITAANEGQSVQAVAPLVTEYASNLVISNDFAQEKGITTDMTWQEKAERLGGGTFAISGRGSGQDLLWRYVLAEGGLDPERDAELTLISGGAAPMVAALRQGQIDGFGFGSPSPDQAVQSGDAMYLALPSEGELEDLAGFLYVVAASPREFVEENPDVVQRVVNAEKRALEMIQEDPDAASDILYENFFDTLEREVWDIAWEHSVPAYPADVTMSDEALALNFEFLGIEDPGDWSPFLDRQFVEAAGG